jgi:hypothetical protein
MIKYIINKIKGWFTPNQNKDEHLVLYEDMPEPDVPVHEEEPKKCGTHNRYKKSCLICRELRQAGVI